MSWATARVAAKAARKAVISCIVLESGMDSIEWLQAFSSLLMLVFFKFRMYVLGESDPQEMEENR